MNNLALVIIILGLIGVFIFRKNKSKRNIFIAVSIAAFLVFGLTMDKDDKNETTVESSSTEKTVESKSKKIEKTIDSTETTFNELEQAANDSLNDFSTFVTNYQKIPMKEKTPFWDKVYGTKVTWTGTAIQEGGNRVYIIDSSRYTPDMTWDSVSGTEDEYYTFVAKFNDKITDGTFITGNKYSFTGSLESRGTDQEMGFFSHWKLYDAVQN
ncbi:hypothetical protein ACYSNW_01270 [Enterococcus sp. LJL99]